MAPKITRWTGTDGLQHQVSTPHEDQWDNATWQAQHDADVAAAQVIYPPA